MLVLVHGRGGQREAVGDLELRGDIGADEESSSRSRECAGRVLDDAHDHEGLDLDLAQRRGGVRSSRHDGYDQVCRIDLEERYPGMGGGGSGAEAVVQISGPVLFAAPRRVAEVVL